MEPDSIVARIQRFLETEFPNPGGSLTEHTDLLEEWFLDSMAIIETVLFLEREFGVRIDRRDINGIHFRNIRSLAMLVQSRLTS